MQKLLLAVTVLINLRYMVFGVAPAIAWITNVVDVFNYLFISQSTNCEDVPTLATLPKNENSLLSMYLWLWHICSTFFCLKRECIFLTFQNSFCFFKRPFKNYYVDESSESSYKAQTCYALLGCLGIMKSPIVGDPQQTNQQ